MKGNTVWVDVVTSKRLFVGFEGNERENIKSMIGNTV
jgi:hypothetical protein